MFEWTNFVWVDSKDDQPSDFLMSQIRSELTNEQITDFYHQGFYLATLDLRSNFNLQHALELTEITV